MASLGRTIARLVRSAVGVAAVATAAAPAYAQDFGIFEVSGDWIPASDVIGPDGGDTANVRAELGTFSAGFNVPVSLGKRALLIPGARYSLLSIDQDARGMGIPSEMDLHVAQLSLLFNYRLSDSWSFSLQATPALSGDFVQVGGEHFRLGGAAIVSYAFSQRFTLSLGIAASWQFGEPLPLPAIQVRWRILDTLRFQAFLPTRAELVWQPHDRIELGISAMLNGQSYALTSARFKERWPCRGEAVDNPATTAADERVANPEQCFTTLAYSRGDVGPTVGVRLTSSLWLSVRTAFAFFQRYEFLNDMNEVPDAGDLSLEPNVVVRAQLTLRIPGS